MSYQILRRIYDDYETLGSGEMELFGVYQTYVDCLGNKKVNSYPEFEAETIDDLVKMIRDIAETLNKNVRDYHNFVAIS